MALYRAKADGRGTYHFFQPEMDAQMQARRVLELDLRKALAAGEFELLLPAAGRRRDSAGQRLRGAGALEPSGRAAWCCAGRIHPAGGGNRPDRAARRMGAAGRPARRPPTGTDELSVAINLSPAQFRNHTLVLSVISALGASGLAATRLELEITEMVLLQDTADGARGAASAPRARRAHLDGRFRHRLFLAQLSAQLPVRQDQDRPLVRRRTRQEERLRCDHPRGHRPRRQPRHGDDRGRRRDQGAARNSAGRGLHPGAGLSVRPAAAGQRKFRSCCGSWRRCNRVGASPLGARAGLPLRAAIAFPDRT